MNPPTPRNQEHKRETRSFPLSGESVLTVRIRLYVVDICPAAPISSQYRQPITSSLANPRAMSACARHWLASSNRGNVGAGNLFTGSGLAHAKSRGEDIMLGANISRATSLGICLPRRNRYRLAKIAAGWSRLRRTHAVENAESRIIESQSIHDALLLFLSSENGLIPATDASYT